MLRRHFVGWMLAIAAFPTSLRAASRRWRASLAGQRAMPTQAAVRALGAALLPSELGPAKLEVASDAFWRWMNGYREGAELLHPYGSPRISFAGKSPVPAWTRQLDELDRAARSKHGAAFAALNVKTREMLVRDALAAINSERLTNIVAAPHIALGMLAHFYESSAATDLCYRARIGRNSCRPLAHNGRKPLPIT